MTVQKNRTRYILFGWILPFCFLAPELINVGFMYLRWDYLLIAVYAAAIALSGSKKSRSFNWSRKTLAIVLLYTLFSIYQASLLATQSGLLEGIKYASWPLKVLFWGLSVYLIYNRLNCSMRHVYLFIRNVTILVFAIQILELTFPEFRSALFDFYPVAAHERLIELTFRARGPFNGYDLASIYFVVAGVFVHQYHRHHMSVRPESFVMYAICLVGAFISARTGFLILLTYFIIYAYINSKIIVKAQLLSIVAIFISLIYFTPVAEFNGIDDSILGRYYELINGLVSGDFEQISSVAGTFYMNEVLLEAGGIGLFGQGLTADTTADQLYFKYLFMLGLTGLLVWISVHLYLIVQAYSGINADGSPAVYSRIVFLISIILAIAHIKGGNYFFASRLGDIIAFLLILSTAKLPSDRITLGDISGKANRQPL
jgi:hypothetical protein